MKNLLWVSFLLTLAYPVYAVDFTLETIKISPRVVVFRAHDRDFPVGGRIRTTAVATDKGIVLIDLMGRPNLIDRIRNEIESIFQRSDYVYIINTGANVNFLGGNVHFPNVEIIGHTNLKRDAEASYKSYLGFVKGGQSSNQAMQKFEKDSDEYKAMCYRNAYMQERVHWLENEYEFKPPTITFSDRLTLNCGDLTLKLVYFGGNSDAIVVIPEEQLLITAMALSSFIPPNISANPNNDISRWITVLNEIIDYGDKIKHLRTGFYDTDGLKTEDIIFIRDYYKDMWQGIQSLKSKGHSLEEVTNMMSIEKKFAHYTQFKDIINDVKFPEYKECIMFLLKLNIMPVPENITNIE